MSLPPDIVGSVAGASPSHPTEANRGTLRLGPEAATRVGSEEPWLAQNTISANC